jgi:serine/threonine protein kinase
MQGESSDESGPVGQFSERSDTEKVRVWTPPSVHDDGLMPAPPQVGVGIGVYLPGVAVEEPRHRDTTKMPALVESDAVPSTQDRHDTQDGNDTQPGGSTADGNALARPIDALALGPGQLLDSYRIVRALGEGAMGAVFEAEHVHIGRRVALKVLHPEAQQDTVQRFFDEARVVNRVRHPNIVDMTDLVYREGHPPYIVMELLTGNDLAQEIAREAPLTPARIVSIGAAIADALAALHAVGMVHRDLKPANIFLTDDDTPGPEVRLIDFGVAKVLERDATVNHPETRHGAIVGTIEYMSPEQALGEPIDTTTDVWALGVVLHEMATGERPFAAGSLGELLYAFTSQQPNAKRVKPASLSRLLMRCFASEPKERPTMRQLSDQLAKIKV